jgi:hypothetical protein
MDHRPGEIFIRRGAVKMRANLMLLAIGLVLAIVATSCTSTQTGTVVGGGIGAGAGAIIGHQSGRSGEGAIIGAALGAIGGAIVGNEIDKSKQPPTHARYGGEYYRTTEPPGAPYGGYYHEGDRSQEGRKWVPEHEEVHVYTAPDGVIYEKRILVPGHYE